MRLLFALLILALPALTVAQQAEAPSPAAVDAPKADAPPLAAAATPTQTPTEQILSSFPTWAVSKAGAETTGQPEPTPAPAATPAAPAAAPAVPAAAPGRPEPPASARAAGQAVAEGHDPDLPAILHRLPPRAAPRRATASSPT
ncbi:MAG: hypothetical protein WDN72_09435 [Alphaproteobacteria bacterium]